MWKCTAFLAVVALLAAACTAGSDTALSDTTADAEATTAVSSDEVLVGGGEGSVTLVNTTDVTICVIAAAVDGAYQWNDDILEDSLDPGATWTMSDLPPMVVDLRALDCSGEIVDVAYGYQVEDGPVWEITAADFEIDQPPPPPTTADQEWLVMLYLDADDEMMEQYMLFNLNEAELTGSSDRVHVVAQVDRFEGGFVGDGNWSSARRFHVTQDDDLAVIGSEEVSDLGEVNMADESTLADFVTWAVETYPADKHVLVMHDHGAGWPGGWTDGSAAGDLLTLAEIEGALAQVREDTGLDQLELIGFDACLMSSLEVYTAMAPYARYAVASEGLEPHPGWAYGSFLADLASNPDMSGADLAQSVVEHYIDDDVILVGTPEEQLRDLKSTITLAAVDLAMLGDVLASLDELAVALGGAEQDRAAVARFYAQSYYNVFVPGAPQPYLDLGHLSSMLAEEVRNDEVFRASRQMTAVLAQAVIAEKHGPARPGSTGITVYFPNSTLYEYEGAGSDSRTYASQAGSFADQTLWDDYLVTHYTGTPMPEPGAGEVAFASADEAITGPGVGDIVIGAISSSSDVFSADDPVFAETTITGTHIARIFVFSGTYDEATGSIRLLRLRPVESENSREVAGVVYPDWAAETVDGTLGIGGDIPAEDVALFDGQSGALALCIPEDSGPSVDPTCLVSGHHVSEATGEKRFAVMRWSMLSPTMLDFYVFAEAEGAVTPFRYTAQPGDEFIPVQVWMDLDNLRMSFTPGDQTLTFGDRLFTWETPPSEPGDYALGVIVEDMDANLYTRYVDIAVEAGS